ncbi:MAG: hypothetical protein JNM39_10250 [Bdellovibrionaceae bacterium]|nr:hypothetical protein [Pseudobdellovibrionaceae bacterium]
MIKTLFSLTLLTVLSSLNVYAEIDTNIDGPLSRCIQQDLKFDQAGNMYIADALECKSMYNSHYYVEFAVANAAFQKEIYIVQSIGKEKIVKKEGKGYYIKSATEFPGAMARAALYLGQDSGGLDRFLIKLAKPFGPEISPVIDIYVKMAIPDKLPQQFAIENLVLTPK